MSTTKRLREMLDAVGAQEAYLYLHKSSNGSTQGAWWDEADNDDPASEWLRSDEAQRFSKITVKLLNSLPALLDRLDRAEALLRQFSIMDELPSTEFSAHVHAFLAEK
jgi:hypothetical protein